MTIRFDTFAASGRGWQMAFPQPEVVQTAHTFADVRGLVDWVDRESAAGNWAVLCLTYEAAGAFDEALQSHHGEDLPLAWAAKLATPLTEPPAQNRQPYTVSPWETQLLRPDYASAIDAVQAYIAAGDTYQVNLTFPLQASFAGDPLSWYFDLAEAQRAGYCAFLDLGRFKILSLSPELFFERRGDSLITRPMKGTVRRGQSPSEDRRLKAELQRCPKNRAENVMIVDLLRNDLGRVARPDSVQVPRLFEVEPLEHVFQMTSTVTAACGSDTPLLEIMRALFPCGSVTGAPKVRTMEIIRAIEPHARGVYTGAIGVIKPGGDAVFSVPIRTVLIDVMTGLATFGVGGGITADSTAGGEYEECRMKAAFLESTAPDFRLLESLRLEDGELWLLERHLGRIAASAASLGVGCDPGTLREALCKACAEYAQGVWKVRMLVDRDGGVTVEVHPLPIVQQPWKIALADTPVNSRNRFLRHKTTCRGVYDSARSQHPDCDDVVLWNEQGELTESCFANLVLTIDGQRFTPPATAGLLPGTFRAELLDRGLLVERRLCKDDLTRATAIQLINSVRGWIDADWCMK